MSEWDSIVDRERQNKSRLDNPHQHLEPRLGDASSRDPWERIVATHDKPYARPLRQMKTDKRIPSTTHRGAQTVRSRGVNPAI
jgi:hypothetical protein